MPQTPPSPDDIERDGLINDLGLFEAELAIIRREKAQAVDAIERSRHDQREQSKLEEYRNKHERLKELEQNSPESYQRYNSLDQDLPLLDFAQAKRRVEDLFKGFDKENQGGSAVLLIQKSNGNRSRGAVLSR